MQGAKKGEKDFPTCLSLLQHFKPATFIMLTFLWGLCNNILKGKVVLILKKTNFATGVRNFSSEKVEIFFYFSTFRLFFDLPPDFLVLRKLTAGTAQWVNLSRKYLAESATISSDILLRNRWIRTMQDHTSP